MPNITSVIWTQRDAERLESWVPQHFTFGSWEKCFYCGEPSEAMDHVIPWSFLSCRDRKSSAGTAPGIKTASCGNCNSLLSDYFFSSLALRCEYLQQRLQRKFRSVLRVRAIWDEEEKRSMGKSILSVIKIREEQRKIASMRTSWQTTSEFTELFESSYNRSIECHPENIELQNFMRPNWLSPKVIPIANGEQETASL